MIETEKVRFPTNDDFLCNTYSTENFRLKQIETGIIYGSSVIDTIEGYDDDGKPYSRYSYIETDEKDEESEEE